MFWKIQYFKIGRETQNRWSFNDLLMTYLLHLVEWWKKGALSLLPTVSGFSHTNTIAVNAKWLRKTSLQTPGFSLHLKSPWFAVLGAVSATLRPCFWLPTWQELLKIKVRLYSYIPLTCWVRDSWSSQRINSHFSVIDLGRKSLSCSSVDGEGETAAHQSVRDADCSCMLTWQPRSEGPAKWLSLIQLLGMKVDT